MVRQFVGYERYIGMTVLHRLEALYQPLRLYVTFFQPVQKLVAKERVGARVRKRYDIAKTPYQRVLESDSVSAESKRRLREHYIELSAAALLRQIEALQTDLWANREL